MMYRILGLVQATILASLFLTTSSLALEAEEVQEIGIDEMLGQKVPFNVEVTTDAGTTVTLGTFFDGIRPVILVPTYYNCPRVCTLILDGVDAMLKQISGLWLGRDFQIVAFSIGPEDTVEDAAERSRRLRKKMGRSTHDEASMHFVVASASAISEITNSIGYRYRKDGDDYAHPAAILFASGDGTITRYLYGISFRPNDAQLAIREAKSGTINDRDIQDKVLLYCYKYDPIAKKYVLVAQNVMTIGGYITLTVVVVLFGSLWMIDRKRRDKKEQET